MLEKLIGNGFHVYVSYFLLGVAMIFFIKGRIGDKKEIFRDSFVILVLVFLTGEFAHLGIYRVIPKGLVFIYGLDIFISIGVYLYVKFIYKVKYSEILALVYNFIVMAIYIVVLFIDCKLSFIKSTLQSSEVLEFINIIFVYSVLPISIIAPISHFASKWRNEDELNFGKTDEKVLIGIFIIAYFILARTESIATNLPYINTRVWVNSYNMISDDKFLVSVGIIALTILNFYFYIRANKRYENICYNKINDNMRKYTEAYLDKIAEHSDRISKLSHDFMNHMMVIESLSNEKNDNISEYAGPLKNNIDNLPIKVRTGNNIADIILNEKISDMEKLGIKWDTKAVVPKEIKMDQYDFSAILFNTIDNSIEACRDIENSKISIEIFPKGKSLVYIIENDYLEDRESEKTYSVKENIDSGYGLKIVNEIVEKYFGKVEIKKTMGKYKFSAYFKVL